MLDILLRPISGGADVPPPEPPPPDPPPPDPPPTVAEPHVVATPAGALAGSVWVEGAELHYIASTGVEYAGTGTAISSPAGAVAGSLWAEAEDVFYIDASGVTRRVVKTSAGAKAAEAVAGSLWIDSGAAAGRQFQWVSSATRYQFWNGIA